MIGPHMNARQRMIRAIMAMPYAGDIAPPKFDPLKMLPDQPTEIEWLDQVTHWIEQLAQRLHLVAETNTTMQAELGKLRGQRAAIRLFLGTDGIGEEG